MGIHQVMIMTIATTLQMSDNSNTKGSITSSEESQDHDQSMDETEEMPLKVNSYISYTPGKRLFILPPDLSYYEKCLQAFPVFSILSL